MRYSVQEANEMMIMCTRSGPVHDMVVDYVNRRIGITASSKGNNVLLARLKNTANNEAVQQFKMTLTASAEARCHIIDRFVG